MEDERFENGLVSNETTTYVSMKGTRIVVFNEDVHRAIVMVPSVLDLFLARRRWTIEQDIEADGKVFARL